MRAGEGLVRPFWEGRLLAQGRGCRRSWAMIRQHSLTIHQEDGPRTCLAAQWLRLSMCFYWRGHRFDFWSGKVTAC